MATETYALTDFPNDKCAPDALEAEIIAKPGITTQTTGVTTIGSDVIIGFKAALSASEKTALDAVVAAHQGIPLPDPTDDNGVPLVQMEHRQGDDVPLFAFSPRVGDEEILATSNLADKCSWFGDSTRVTDETLVVDGSDPTLYESDHEWWIDMFTGRLLNEEKWEGEVSHGYQVVVEDNGVEQTVRPFPSCPGTWDCEILYKEGKVKFLDGAPTGPVTASYSYAGGSTFYLEPEADHVLKIESGEADFSVGDADGDYRIIFTTEIHYDIWGYAWYYAPQYPSVPVSYTHLTLPTN